jgi:hypothetical protein
MVTAIFLGLSDEPLSDFLVVVVEAQSIFSSQLSFVVMCKRMLEDPVRAEESPYSCRRLECCGIF